MKKKELKNDTYVSHRSKYDHNKVEKYWQGEWEKKGLYYPNIGASENKFYNLWMFPYPSAEGLHAGHAFASTGSDVFGRFRRMNGKTVFQPIGYDSFGLHSENFAIKINDHPKKMIDRTTKNYERQMRSLGHGYDWTRTVTTSDIDYYRWTQWLFTEMFKSGLAYRKKAKVNWCPSCRTVISDEQVVTPAQAGKEPKDEKGNILEAEEGMRVCERCGYLVQDKELEQWMFRITDYADKLLNGLDKIEWPEKIKIAQRNWIGKSTGVEVEFKIKNSNIKIKVFTTRPDTLFGATFMVVAPEYARELLLNYIPKKNLESVNKYINKSLSKSSEERIENKEKTGVDIGLLAINPVNNKEIPVYVADYVLFGYGTGAIMAVPAHDERDFAFAKKFDLPVIKVINQKIETHALLVKRSLKDGFADEIKNNGWFITDYLEWGCGVVVPAKDDKRLIKLVQQYLKDEPWYAHTDGRSNVVIFKDRVFDMEKENEEAKNYARKLGISEEQIDWDDRNNFLFCHDKEGRLVNSEKWNGIRYPDEFDQILSDIEKNSWGKRKSQYHLRDWLISRQRYWGPPIPMIYCMECAKNGKSWFNTSGGKTESPQTQVRASHNAKSERGDKSDFDSLSDLSKEKLLHTDQSDWDSAGWFPEENLPVELPFIEKFEPEGTGRGPLANHPEFYKITCPECGSEAKRETDVSDTFLDSAWYFLRYPSARSARSGQVPFDKDITKAWLPVDLYFGGAEHSVLHLMYARFVTQFLNDLGYLGFDEPFPRFFAHGLMIKDGAKMSKSRGNVVNPDEYIEKFGADTMRLYLMFMGPMDGYPDFRDTGIEGMRRFVEKLWHLFNESKFNVQDAKYINIKMHQTIKKVTQDIQEFKYNTAIAAIMEYTNALRDSISNFQFSTSKQLKNETMSQISKDRKKNKNQSVGKYLETLVLLLAPFTPHLAEEVWQNVFGNKSTVHEAPWPKYNPEMILEETTNIPVQVNGKLRTVLEVTADKIKDEDFVIKEAKKDPKVQKWLTGKKVKKEIYVRGKLVSIVILNN